MKPSFVFTQLGSIARDCLASDRHGKVLAVFSKAIYLLTEADELFWITSDDSPMHRRCAQIRSPLPEPLAGSPFRVADHRLIIDPDLTFDIDSASLWHEPRLDPNHVLEIRELPSRVQTFFSNLNLSQSKGFGSFIPYLLSLSQNESINSSSEIIDPILRFAQPYVMNMARAALEHDPSQMLYHAEKIIGLGAGLTPSGDDFIGGLSFAVNHLQAAYPDSGFTNYTIPIELYRLRTHLISFTLLQDHAEGHAIAPLHHIINNFLTGESLESTYPFISQLTQMGHSTGWDLLSGLLTGLLITHQI